MGQLWTQDENGREQWGRSFISVSDTLAALDSWMNDDGDGDDDHGDDDGNTNNYCGTSMCQALFQARFVY